MADVPAPITAPNDFGPWYTETIAGIPLGRIPVEPFNTLSNLIFLIIVVDCIRRTKLNLHRYPLVVTSLPILLVGWFGGTMYHATRASRWWLILDFMPILLLTSAAAIALWRFIAGSYLRSAAIVVLLVFLSRALTRLEVFPLSIRFSLAYAGLASTILVPLAIVVRRRISTSWPLFVLCAVSFCIAVAFRSADRWLGESWLPMGSHFLWHLFGGSAVWFLMVMLIRLNDAAETKRIT